MDDCLEFRLLNDFQRDFPLCPAPFEALGERLGVAEAEVLGRLDKLKREGKISRVGPVLTPRCFGASTLAALAVPPERLAEMAAIVSRFAEVNHNYEREHRYNLWFVVTAPSQDRLQSILAAIAAATGYRPLSLPLQEQFHIDLGFPLDARRHARQPMREAGAPEVLDEAGRRLLAALQEGLPLLERPFALIAERIGTSENEVMAAIRGWLASGAIKRFGIVVRHRPLGFAANAMLVHDVPDAEVSRVGSALAGEGMVTLCYRRPRRLPDWRYNLFCMIHGRVRPEVEAAIADLRQRHGLGPFAHDVLFSTTCFKQTGARYV